MKNDYIERTERRLLEQQYGEKLGCQYCEKLNWTATYISLVCRIGGITNPTDYCLEFELDEAKWNKLEEERIENKSW